MKQDVGKSFLRDYECEPSTNNKKHQQPSIHKRIVIFHSNFLNFAFFLLFTSLQGGSPMLNKDSELDRHRRHNSQSRPIDAAANLQPLLQKFVSQPGPQSCPIQQTQTFVTSVATTQVSGLQGVTGIVFIMKTRLKSDTCRPIKTATCDFSHVAGTVVKSMICSNPIWIGQSPRELLPVL